MIRTADTTSWDLNSNHLKLDKNDDGLKIDNLIRLEPGLPYLYLPKTVYDEFIKFMSTKYAHDVCHPEINICKF